MSLRVYFQTYENKTNTPIILGSDKHHHFISLIKFISIERGDWPDSISGSCMFDTESNNHYLNFKIYKRETFIK